MASVRLAADSELELLKKKNATASSGPTGGAPAVAVAAAADAMIVDGVSIVGGDGSVSGGADGANRPLHK